MLWTVRVGLLTLFGSLLYIYVLNVLRFFRPANAKAMITGPLPRLRQVGGKIAGVEATASLAESDESLGREVEVVNRRVSNVLRYLDGLSAHVGYPAPGEGHDDEPRVHPATDGGDARKG
ncbi:MAG TPA: hypothetical protein VFJ82_11365 [Longimicrobium sp.]|nr:hypothetical protein [Longimicrobium sp.]